MGIISILGDIVVGVFALLGIKAVMGFHFPWEPIAKAKKRLKENLDSVKSQIPSSVYKKMQDDIEHIR